MKKRRKSKNVTRFGQLVRTSFVIACLGVAVILGYFGASIWKDVKDLPDVSALERYEPIEAIQLFDRNDKLICTVEGDEDRQVVPLNQVSTQMQQAMLAAEDHHFYEHHGINPVSIFRAFLANMHAGKVVEGGSTITQQLVKNLFFEDPKRDVNRKVKEAFMAWELERRYSKERILELYLNQVYFGNGAYGIERAAYRYFGKSAAQLNIAEAAFIAGVVKAPSELSNPNNRKVALSRQHEIINKMVEYGYITKGQAEIAEKTELKFKKGTTNLQKYPYYISYVMQLLGERFSQAEMRRQGLRVYTCLDPQAQQLAEETINKGIEKAPKGVTQGALVSINVHDGSVLALVGGAGDFWKNQWNRATNPHTTGSSFKPFVYLTAFIKGALTPESTILDTPLVVKQRWGGEDYAPQDFDHKFMGKITVRKALTLSRNVPSVRIAQLVGVENIIETARLAGITSKLDPNLSLALGSSAASPLEMAGAYATLARFGVALKPQVLRRIENNRGEVLDRFEPQPTKVFDPMPVCELISIMQDVVLHGTGTQARLADRPVAGKTGTADEAKDIWFIGFTPDMVTAVWGGNDDNQSIPGSNVTGGMVMAKIWKQYNEAYYKLFPTPPGAFISPGELKKQEGVASDTPPTFSLLPQTPSNSEQGQAPKEQGNAKSNMGDPNQDPTLENKGTEPQEAQTGENSPEVRTENTRKAPSSSTTTIIQADPSAAQYLLGQPGTKQAAPNAAQTTQFSPAPTYAPPRSSNPANELPLAAPAR